MEWILAVATIALIYYMRDTVNMASWIDVKILWVVFIYSFAFLYGWLEHSWLQHAGTSGPKEYFGHFSIYHVFMLEIFTLIVFSYWFIVWPLPAREVYKGWVHLPSLFLIEDISYRIADTQWPEPGSWIDWPNVFIISGFDTGLFYIPAGYLWLLILMLCFYQHELIILFLKPFINKLRRKG